MQTQHPVSTPALEAANQAAHTEGSAQSDPTLPAPAVGDATASPQPNAPSLEGRESQAGNYGSDQTGMPAGAEALTQEIDFFTDDNALADVEGLLATEYGRVVGVPNAAIDPATIAILIEFALSLFKKCQESRAARAAAGGTAGTPAGLGEQYSRMAKRANAFTRATVNSEVRQMLNQKYGPFAYRRYNGDNIARTLLSSAANASPQQMQKFAQAASF